MNTVYFANKGGQGTTVTAAAHALTLAAGGIDTILVDYRGDAAGVLGMVEPEHYEATPVCENLRVIVADRASITYDVVGLPFAEVYIFDANAEDVVDIATRWDATPVVVVRNCYLAMRKSIAGPTAERAVLVSEPGRALHPSDIEAILNIPTTVVKVDPAVARAVDAGLLATRLPAGMAAA